jgi:hypothetical protein
MSWTNVPFKNPGDPVTAENWNGLVGNIGAVADAEPGAPRILLPEAGRTEASDPQVFLAPDGAGGVRWTKPQLALRTSTTVLEDLGVGSWVAWASAFTPATRDEGSSSRSGWAVVVNGSVILQTMINEAGGLGGGFSMSGGDLRFLYDPFSSGTSRRLMAIRVG